MDIRRPDTKPASQATRPHRNNARGPLPSKPGPTRTRDVAEVYRPKTFKLSEKLADDLRLAAVLEKTTQTELLVICLEPMIREIKKKHNISD